MMPVQRGPFRNGVEIPAQHVHGAYMAALNAVYAKVLSVDDAVSLL